MNHEFPISPESALSTMSELFQTEGKAREVAITANAEAEFVQVDYDNWNGGTYVFDFNLQIPSSTFSTISDEVQECASEIMAKIMILTGHLMGVSVRAINIIPSSNTDPEWRAKPLAWLAGSGINNQGRVRSDNIASRECDGLLFRSRQEIYLYKALKKAGVAFAPLPVFVRGGADYKRIEPDFIILKDGVIMMIEVDGDTVHRETPAEAHDRTTMLAHEGAHIERVKASDCDNPEAAKVCVARLLAVIEKIKSRR